MKKIIFLLGCVLAFHSSFSQVLSYIDEEIPVDYVPVDLAGGAAVALATAGEDEVYPLPIPFTFNYFGTLQPTIFVSTNGNASFGQSYQGRDFNREALCYPVTSLYDPAREQDAANPDNFIAVAWDDLFLDPTCLPASGDVPSLSWTLEGAAPNQVLLITWDYLGRSGDLNCIAADPGTYIRAQLKLYEGTDVIEVHIEYNRLTERRITIGVENADATYANFVKCGEEQADFEKVAWRFTPSEVEDPGNVPPTGTSYCEAQGEMCGDYGTIGEFTWDTITVAGRGCEGGLLPEDAAYADNTDITFVYELGTPVDFSGKIANDLDILGVPFPSSTPLWIDWNQDTIFSEDEMTLATQDVENGDIATFIGTVMDPVGGGAIAGITRMRVRTYNTGNCQETPNPCGQTCGNEVEDFHILVIDPANPIPNCPTFVSPSHGDRDVCQTTTINWNQPANVVADSFNIQISAGSNPKVNLFLTDTFYTNTIPYPTNTPVQVIVNAYAGEQNSQSCDTLIFLTAPAPDPNVTISPNGDPIFTCKGSNLPLSGVLNYPDNITHTWSGPAAAFLNFTDIENPVYNNLAEDTLKLYYYAVNDFGCDGTDSTSVITLDGARLEDYSILNPTPCEGDSVIALVKGAVGNVVFEDSISGGTFTEIMATQISDSTYYLPNLTGTHFIKLSVLLGDCDVRRDTIRVTVKPLPTTPTIAFFDGENGGGCIGDAVGMRITNFEPSMTWNDANLTNNDTLVVTASGDYLVNNVLDGCSAASSALEVRINENPTPVISRDFPTACLGDTLRLSVETIYASVKWDIATEDSLKNTIRVFEDGTYTVEVSDENGCLGSASEMVSFFAKPSQPTINQLDASPACAGNEVRLVANYSDAGAWNTNETGDTLYVTTEGSYFYTSTNSDGCSTSSENVSVDFFSSATKLNVTVSPAGPYCTGDTVVLTSQIANNNTWNTGATTQSIEVYDSGIFFVESTDQNGCEISSDDIQIAFGQFPAQPSIIQSDNRLASTVQGKYYEWTRNGVPLNVNTRIISIERSGNYQVRVFNDSGCRSEFSETYFAQYTGIEEQLFDNGISVFPNPSSDGLIRIKDENAIITNIEVSGIDGKQLNFEKVSQDLTQVQLPKDGFYIIRLYTANDIISVRVVVQ